MLQGAVEMQSMAGHITGPSAGQYPPQKPQPEALSAHAHPEGNPQRLPNGQAHLVRHIRASKCSSRPAVTNMIPLTGFLARRACQVKREGPDNTRPILHSISKNMRECQCLHAQMTACQWRSGTYARTPLKDRVQSI